MTSPFFKLRRRSWEGADAREHGTGARPVSPVAVAPDSLPAATAADRSFDERRVAALLRPRTGLVSVQPKDAA